MSVTFSKDQQSAILGHCIIDPRIFLLAQEVGIKPGWFNHKTQHQVLWDALTKFWTKYKRHPTFTEYQQAECFTKRPAVESQHYQDILTDCLGNADSIGADTCVPVLKEWRKEALTITTMGGLSAVWEKDTDKAYKIIAELAADHQKIDALGLNARIDTATNRVKDEQTLRKANAANRLSFGIEFLDDALLGMGPHDVIVIGAKTGVGKTQAVTHIAAHNCLQNKRVAYLALEAEDREIERRIKYGVLSRMYRAKYDRYGGSYIEWLTCKLDQKFAEFEDACTAEFESKYSNLTTLYRLHGDYGVAELEADIMRLAKNNDLIIIDHLQYVDVGDTNENKGVKEIVKHLRDLALLLAKPIILISHVRKETGPRKQAPLVPQLDDLHGSSDIQKIATAVVIIERARECGVPLNVDAGEINPTYITVAKSRTFGSLQYYGAVCFYDAFGGGYLSGYGIGQFENFYTKFVPVNRTPAWAKHATIELIK